jgi:hypothetical protein
LGGALSLLQDLQGFHDDLGVLQKILANPLLERIRFVSPRGHLRRDLNSLRVCRDDKPPSGKNCRRSCRYQDQSKSSHDISSFALRRTEVSAALFDEGAGLGGVGEGHEGTAKLRYAIKSARAC